MALRRHPPPPEEWEVIRYKYEHTDLTIPEICAEHTISDGTLRDRVRRWGWTRRRAPIPRQGPPPRPLPVAPAFDTPPQPAAPPASDPLDATIVPFPVPGVDPPAPGDAAMPPDDTPLALRLQRAVERQLTAIETVAARLGGPRAHAGESERAARALATLTRTLRELNTLQSQQPEPSADDDRSPDIDERRRALARKIDAFLASQRGGVRDNAEPEGA
jgi:hypothetical protein